MISKKQVLSWFGFFFVGFVFCTLGFSQSKLSRSRADVIDGLMSSEQKKCWPNRARRTLMFSTEKLSAEKLANENLWIDPELKRIQETQEFVPVTVWFEDQLLGDGEAFARRSAEFSGQPRTKLARRAVNTLKSLAEHSFHKAQKKVLELVNGKKITLVRWHWIVNGFSCFASKNGIESLKQVPGVKVVYWNRQRLVVPPNTKRKPEFFQNKIVGRFNPDRFQHPWYTHYLLAEKTWKDLDVSGAGTLNVVMDGNFVFSPNVTSNLYRNPGETPGNGVDDDGNGLIDDFHGFNFVRHDALLTIRPTGPNPNAQDTHGFMCAAEICGTGTDNCPYEFGLAPSGSWAAVIAGQAPEAAIEWAIEQGADTLSMSFSRPGLGEFRSHWRKIMEQANFCGLCPVSGAGNFAQKGSRTYAPVPIQLRVPEDIPYAVFAPAGVRRDFSRTPFSSQGPVKWETEHYRDGLVDKPDFCAFNIGLPRILPNESVRLADANGNSFAGPMVAGTLALMLSADPDLLPWDARTILIDTATDIGSTGNDFQTGNGLINCYRAVREVLRRKSVREGNDPKPFTGRVKGDELNIQKIQSQLDLRKLFIVLAVTKDSVADQAGIKRGDILQSISGKKIESNADIRQMLDPNQKFKPGKINLQIRRAGIDTDLELKIPENGRWGFRYGMQSSFESPVFN